MCLSWQESPIHWEKQMMIDARRLVRPGIDAGRVAEVAANQYCQALGGDYDPPLR
jgi:hypothetical protein